DQVPNRIYSEKQIRLMGIISARNFRLNSGHPLRCRKDKRIFEIKETGEKILILRPMLQKLQAIKEHWQEVERELSNPATVSDMKRFAKLNKEYKDLGKIVDKYHIYKNVVSNIESNKNILATEKDQELKEMAKEELDLLLEQKEELE